MMISIYAQMWPKKVQDERLTSFRVAWEFVDIGIGVVRSMSASISDMSSENPFVIVVSPVVEVLN